MKKCYVIYYEDANNDDTEIVQEGSLLKYVKEMIADERINPENIEFWIEGGNRMPITERECIDFLENDGWSVKVSYIYAK